MAKAMRLPEDYLDLIEFKTQLWAEIKAQTLQIT